MSTELSSSYTDAELLYHYLGERMSGSGRDAPLIAIHIHIHILIIIIVIVTVTVTAILRGSAGQRSFAAAPLRAVPALAVMAIEIAMLDYDYDYDYDQR